LKFPSTSVKIKNMMSQSKQTSKGFTLIELIIVVVIIGILALIAIPRYSSNIAKAKRNEAYSTMHVIRNALLDYYAVYGRYPADNSFPIVVTVDGDTVVNLASPNNQHWLFGYNITSTGDVKCGIAPGWPLTCYHVFIANGSHYDDHNLTVCNP